MEIIGLIGGTGWVSTIEYYRLINEMTKERLGGLNAAKSLIYSVNFAEIEALNQENNTEGVQLILQEAAVTLDKAGVGCMLICANTLHQYVDEVEAKIHVPLIHIAEVTADRILQQGLSKVGLLGTRYTMERDFYHQRLSRRGIECIVPDKTEREFLHHCIMNELVTGDFSMDSKKRVIKIIDQLEKDGAEGVILGCTEIPLLINQDDSRLPLFNTTEIHARAAVDFALK